jgi:hypothetical protein
MTCWRFVVVLTSVAVTVSLTGAQDKTPDIKDIMSSLHRGPDCLRAKLARAVKADSPDWEAVQRETKEFAKLAEALAKNPPPKGDKTSWEKLTKDFGELAKAMEKGAKEKNVAEIKTAHAKLGNCKPCHSLHKP